VRANFSWTDHFTCKCGVDQLSGRYFFKSDHGCRNRTPDALNLARHYVTQHLVEPFLDPKYKTCAPPDEATLTIHARWGDLAAFKGGDGEGQGHLYPCTFYEHLITAYSFKHVIFMTEKADSERERHPCIAGLRQRSDITFTLSFDLADAVCGFLQASNLVVPLSSFSWGLVFGNRRLRRAFTSTFVLPDSWVPEGVLSVEDSCGPGVTKVLRYDIEGFEQKYLKEAKLQYMLNSSKNITYNSQICLL